MVIYSAIFSIVLIIIYRFIITRINKYSDRFLYLRIRNRHTINIAHIKSFYNKKLNGLVIGFSIMIIVSAVFNLPFSSLLNYLLMFLYFVFIALVNTKLITSLIKNFPNTFYDNTIKPYGGILSKETYL